MGGFDRMSKGFQERGGKGLQSILALEDQVGGVLGLHDAPVIGEAQLGGDRAVLSGKLIQTPVQEFNIELVGQLVAAA